MAAQLMANSGFSSTAALASASGVGGLTDVGWKRWAPWSDAVRSDNQANIVALAYQMCDPDRPGAREGGVIGDQWRLALATGIAVYSTNRILHSTCRSGTRFHPGLRNRRGC
ncbi:hypothetical protein ABZS66_33390 [Dactylosporangium sp. NPDC005572]|uniref:hypothetical protein n=1 Tax=Dactylosporangium sp. NPDC005572 TaxID=3156889 RepID=UPI0033AC9D15